MKSDRRRKAGASAMGERERGEAEALESDYEAIKANEERALLSGSLRGAQSASTRTSAHLSLSRLARLLGRLRGDRDEVDAIPIPAAVGEIVAEVRARERDALAIRQDAHIVPDDLGIAEGRPAV